MSGMPNKACPFPGTTNNLHIFVHFYVLILLHRHLLYVMYSCISPASSDFSEVIDLAAVCTLLPIGWALSGWMAGTTITATLLH